MIKIDKNEYNPLIERHEIKALSTAEITPSRIFVQETLSKELKKDKELIIIKKINQKYGSQESEIYAFAYDSQEALKKFEPKKKEKKAKAEVKKEKK